MDHKKILAKNILFWAICAAVLSAAVCAVMGTSLPDAAVYSAAAAGYGGFFPGFLGAALKIYNQTVQPRRKGYARRNAGARRKRETPEDARRKPIYP